MELLFWIVVALICGACVLVLAVLFLGSGSNMGDGDGTSFRNYDAPSSSDDWGGGDD